MSRIRSRVSSAHVMAAVALFVALGGGYAAAFSGTGSLKKAAVNNLDTNWQDVRTLKGFGALQARCVSGGASEIRYRFRAGSNAGYNIRSFNELTGELVSDVVLAGEVSSQVYETDTAANGFGIVRFHLFKAPAGKKGQVDIVASNNGPFGGNCTINVVRVLALNTQE